MLQAAGHVGKQNKTPASGGLSSVINIPCLPSLGKLDTVLDRREPLWGGNPVPGLGASAWPPWLVLSPLGALLGAEDGFALCPSCWWGLLRGHAPPSQWGPGEALGWVGAAGCRGVLFRRAWLCRWLQLFAAHCARLSPSSKPGLLTPWPPGSHLSLSSMTPASLVPDTHTQTAGKARTLCGVKAPSTPGALSTPPIPAGQLAAQSMLCQDHPHTRVPARTNCLLSPRSAPLGAPLPGACLPLTQPEHTASQRPATPPLT